MACGVDLAGSLLGTPAVSSHNPNFPISSFDPEEKLLRKYWPIIRHVLILHNKTLKEAILNLVNIFELILTQDMICALWVRVVTELLY